MIHFLRLVWLESVVKWRIFRAYWVEFVADQLLFILGFLLIAGVFDLVAGGNFDPLARLSSMIGFLTWRVAGGCMAETTISIADDAQYGTLEQVWNSGTPPLTILLARGVMLVLYYTVRVLLMAVVIMPLLRIPFSYAPGAGFIYMLTLLGAFGLAYALSGLHLIFQNISGLTMPLATGLLFFSGAIVSLEGIPGFYALSRLLPLSAGIDLLRALLVDGVSFLDLLRQTMFWGLLANTGFYILLGGAIFRWANQRAKREGLLAHY